MGVPQPAPPGYSRRSGAPAGAPPSGSWGRTEPQKRGAVQCGESTPLRPAGPATGEAIRHVLTTSTTRVLEPQELDEALAVLNRDPVTNAFVAARVQVAGLDPWRLGGEMWGWYNGGRVWA